MKIRHNWISAIAGLWLLATSAQTTALPADENLVVEYQKGALHQVNARYEHTGVVILKAPEQDNNQPLPMEVSALIRYAQRFTGTAKEPQAIRFYESTQADIRIDRGTQQSELAPDNNLIVARIEDRPSHRLQMASVSDVLQQGELELIRNPADPLSYPRMFSRSEVGLGDQWQPDSQAIADFLAVDRIYENELQLTLKSLDKAVAKLYLTGTVKAEVDDVTTQIEISGIALIDTRQKQLTALRTTINEQREAGQVAPGFRGQTKIDLKMIPKQSVPELSNGALAHGQTKRVDRHIKWESKSGHFQIVFDPRWRMIASEDEAAVMRYIDQGDLLAQCTIVQMPSRPADNPLTLEKFQSEVQKIIATQEEAHIIGAQSFRTSTNLTSLRVAVEGIESQVPFHWIYYHVEAEDGRRLTYVFTLEKEIVERFATADKQLVNQTSFKPKAKSTGKTRAAKTQSPPTSRR